jgi:flagellar biosynthetic protein FliS
MDGYELSAYRDVDCVGITPERLMMVALDTLRIFLSRAAIAIDGNNAVEKARLLARAGTVVEFMLGLSGIAPGESSTRLAKLYRFVLDGIVRANVRDDKEALAGALHVIEELTKFWRSQFPTAATTAELPSS